MANGDGTEPVKKKRGNPNFQKNRRNPYYDKDNPDPQNPATTEPTTEKSKTTMADDQSTANTSEETTTTTENGGGTGNHTDNIPNDIFSDEMPPAEELPLDGEVKTNAYGNQHTGNGESGGSSGNGGNNNGGGAGTGNAGTSSSSNINGSGSTDTNQPGVQQPVKSAEEIKNEAEQLVKLLLKGYDKLHGLGRWAAKQDPSELTELHLAGKINLQQELPLGRKTITVQQFFAEYNEGIDENIVVTDEFKDTITPPLVRIAIKRGWTLGDEMFVAMVVSEDLATKASMLIGLKKSANLVLEACHEFMKKQNKANQPPPPNPEPQPRPDQHQDDTTSFEDIQNDGWREEHQ